MFSRDSSPEMQAARADGAARTFAKKMIDERRIDEGAFDLIVAEFKLAAHKDRASFVSFDGTNSELAKLKEKYQKRDPKPLSPYAQRAIKAWNEKRAAHGYGKGAA